MNSDEIKRLEEILKITDGLFKRSLSAQAWILALLDQLVTLEASQSDKSREQIRADVRARQKQVYQRLMENLESRDPGYAAEIDDRTFEDLL
jgi:hypothetical protein